tara:strand:+ start:81 stop:1415 length:1335 start_codon:yes stop_codon:yes gene_type:complete
MDMHELFRNTTGTIQDITRWDTSNVTDMRQMFQSSSFNQDISPWNVGNVTNMQLMFRESNFDQDISGWNVSNVTNMSSMFYFNTNFNQDISPWNVSNVTDMSTMFHSASQFNQDIGSWNVSGVTTMAGMFTGAVAFEGGDIHLWDVSGVSDMNGMFDTAHVFTGDISGWNVSNVTNMKSMFNSALDFDTDIGSWDVGNVTDMEEMFKQANSFDQDISGWNVSSLTVNPPITFSTANNQNWTPLEKPKFLPEAPGTITITVGPNSGEVTLSWTVPQDTISYLNPITGYDLSYNGGSWSSIGLAGSGTSRSHSVTGLSLGIAYTFELRANTEGGAGPSRSSGTVTLQAPPTGTPSINTSTPPYSGSWSAPTSWVGGTAGGYVVYEHDNTGWGYRHPGTGTQSGNGFQFFSAASPSSLGYAVKAVATGGATSEWLYAGSTSGTPPNN